MINSFKDSEVRNSALIYKSTFEQIKKLYNINPEQAGELAISAIELALTGEISSDDYMIDLILENMKVIGEKNKVKYDNKIESQKQKRIEEQKLDLIANLYNGGMKQKDIAVRLNTTPQTISNRMATIRTDFPELLTEKIKQNDLKIKHFNKNQENQVNQSNQAYDNDNDNENDNYGFICSNEQVNQNGVCANAQAPEKFKF